MLDFDDATSLTTLGYDKTAKGNNWTLNNFSLTAGVSYDYMKSVPGNTYCIASEIDKGANPASTTLTEAGLKSACSAVSGGSSACGTQSTTGREVLFRTYSCCYRRRYHSRHHLTHFWSAGGSVVRYVFTGQKSIAGTSSAYAASYAANDIIGVAVDTGEHHRFFKNNASQGVITIRRTSCRGASLCTGITRRLVVALFSTTTVKPRSTPLQLTTAQQVVTSAHRQRGTKPSASATCLIRRY